MSIYSTKTSIEEKIFRQIPLAVFNTLDVEFGFSLDVVASDQNVPCVNYLTLLSFINTKTGKQEEYGNSKDRLLFAGRCKEKSGYQNFYFSRKLLIFPVEVECQFFSYSFLLKFKSKSGIKYNLVLNFVN